MAFVEQDSLRFWTLLDLTPHFSPLPEKCRSWRLGVPGGVPGGVLAGVAGCSWGVFLGGVFFWGGGGEGCFSWEGGR